MPRPGFPVGLSADQDVIVAGLYNRRLTPRWFEPDICPFCWLGEVAAIKTTLSAATQRLKALQALLSQHITAHLGMPDSIPQRARMARGLANLTSHVPIDPAERA